MSSCARLCTMRQEGTISGCRQTAAPMPSYDEGSVCRSGPVIQSAPPKCVRDTVSHQEHADVLVPEHQHRSIAIPATRVARVQHVMGGSMWTQVLRKRSHRGLLICTQPGPLDTEVVRQGLVPAHTEGSVFLQARHQSSHRMNSSEIPPDSLARAMRSSIETTMHANRRMQTPK